MSSQGRDGLFRKALKALLVQLREALVEAELDDPVVLRSFPRASLSRLEVHEGGVRLYTLRFGRQATMVQLRWVQLRLILLRLVLLRRWMVQLVRFGGATSGIGSIGGATMGTESIDGTVTIGGATMGTTVIAGANASALFPGAGKRA